MPARPTAFAAALVALALAACGSGAPDGDPAGSGTVAKQLCTCASGTGTVDPATGDCACPGEATACEDDAACAAGESCADPEADGTRTCVCLCDRTWSCDGACACDPECRSPEPKCRVDADCSAAACEVCVANRCVEACPAGRACDGAGACVGEACAAPADCYPDGFCSSSLVCEGVASLGACGAAANAPPADADGPVIFGGEQVDLDADVDWSCTKEPAVCLNNGNVCAFVVRHWDPQADVPVQKRELYPSVELWLEDRAAGVLAYDVRALDAAAATFQVYGCWDEMVAAPEAAVTLEDGDGNGSNPLCLRGAVR